MDTIINVTNRKKFEKLIHSVDCSKMHGYTGKAVIKFKANKSIPFKVSYDRKEFENKYGFILEINGNVFDMLKHIDVCYSIGVSRTVFKSIGSGLNALDYFIITSKEYEDSLLNFGLTFKDSEDNRYNTIERTLTDDEINIFKSLQDNFVKIIHDKNGRIYELKNKSFKRFYQCGTV